MPRAPTRRTKPSGTLRLRVAVVVEHAAWRRAITDPAPLLRHAARRALQVVRKRGSVVVNVALIDDRAMRKLNRDYGGKDKPTNVLSFPAPERQAPRRRGSKRKELGDIALALGVIRREAKAQRKSVPDHLAHLMVHAVLHLLGYDHESDPAAERMEALERKALAAMGIADPYRQTERRQQALSE